MQKRNREVGFGLLVIPIGGWIAGGILLDEAAKLGVKIGNLDSQIKDIKSNIDLQQKYSAKFEQLDARHNELAAALLKLDQQLELAGNFENSFIEQRNFWKSVSLSYLEIKSKVKVPEGHSAMHRALACHTGGRG